jgi:hypothetical protein
MWTQKLGKQFCCSPFFVIDVQGIVRPLFLIDVENQFVCVCVCVCGGH